VPLAAENSCGYYFLINGKLLELILTLCLLITERLENEEKHDQFLSTLWQ
jgi:hypothetical protein